GLDGRALPEVDGMPNQVSSRPPGDLTGAVGTAVVHADDVVEYRAHIGYHLGDDGCFVEGGNDDPDNRILCFRTHLSPQGTRWCRPDQLVARAARDSATRWTPIPTSGPHNKPTTVRVGRDSGSNSNKPDATVAPTQPSE